MRTAFVKFLVTLSEFDGKDENTSLKLLLTSRTHLHVKDPKKVDNFEVKPLASSCSVEILTSNGTRLHEKLDLL